MRIGPQPCLGCYCRCCHDFQGVNLAPVLGKTSTPRPPSSAHRGPQVEGDPKPRRVLVLARQGLVSGSPQAAAPGARVNLAPGRPARLGRGTRKAEPSLLPAPQAGDSITPTLAQWPFISGSKTLVTVRAEREGLIRAVRGRAPGSRAGTSLPISRAFHGNGSYFPPLLGRHSHAAQTTSVKTCRPPSLGLLGKRDPLAP